MEDCLGKKTLILGDVNTGKTTLTKRILENFCRRGLGDRTAILDMAPEIPETLAREKRLAGVGGRLPPTEGYGVLYLGGRLEPPRLSSKTEEEAMEKARQNRRAIDELFRRLDGRDREILLINDITLYLQAGKADTLILRLNRFGTVVANGYWGERLGGGELSVREKAETERLRSWFEREGRVSVLSRIPS
jgi:hypothetical protein